MGLGISTLMVWVPAKKSDLFRNMEDYATTYAAGISLGGLSLILSLLYLVDFILANGVRKRCKREALERQQQGYW